MAEREALPRRAEHAARPTGERFDELQSRLRREDRGAEPASHLGLAGPAGDGRDFDVGVQRAQDRRRRRAEGAGTVDHGLAARPRRRSRHRMERDGEGVRQHCDLVRDFVGHRNHHGAVGGHQFGETARRLLGVAGVDAGGEASLGEAPAQAQVAGLACGARRFDATRTARQPRIEHDPLAGFDAPRVGADFLHGGDELVAEHLWERDQRRHGIVDLVLGVLHEHLLRVRSADPGHA